MSPEQHDLDRIRRIRDQQIRARDPMVKQRKLDHSISQKRRRMAESFSLIQLWRDLPHMVRSAVVGAILAVPVAIILPAFAPPEWGTCVRVAAFVFLIALGFFLGRYQDSKQEVEDLIRR